ncbi:MAG TPA: ScyD/ScyE family protein [Marmoricola sp.]|nr:ScyD/ScyE family protein [Marmoricola sp.]
MPLSTHRLVGTAAAVGAIALAATLPAQAQSAQRDSTQRSTGVTTVTSALNGPRGVDAVTARRILVAQADGTFSRVVRHLGAPATVKNLGKVPDTGLAPAIAQGLHRTVWILTGAGGEPGAPPAPGASTLYKWRPGWAAPKPFVDIAAYQKTHPDPYNVADDPGESNPYGLVALADGSLLVADAANNDLLRVKKNRHVQEVAMLKPRTVTVPAGLPGAGSAMPSEAVATSVTVGRDGYWYVGELRGFPATPGTSQIWRIKPYTTHSVCDPAHPRRGHCKRYADGLTSIVDLGTGRRGIYAVELSKMSWLAMEAHAPGSDIGALMYVHRVHGRKVMTELAKDQLHLPAGVDVFARNKFVTAPIFGPGSLLRIR